MIYLDATESILLWAAKGHRISCVRSGEPSGSWKYIQAVVNHITASSNGNVFHFYMKLARKLLSANDFSVILENLERRFDNPFIEEPKITRKIITESIIIALQVRRVTDIEMDASLI